MPAWLVAGLAMPSILTAQVDAETFRIQEVRPGIHAALVVSRPPEYAFANSLVVVGDSGVLIVDTQQSPAAARALLRRLPSLTDKPVRWIVNTHWHADHVFGNVVWKEAFPDAVVIGHRSLVDDVPGLAGAYRDDQVTQLPRTIEERRLWLAEGERNGTALTAEERRGIEYSLELRERYLEQLTPLRLFPPEIAVDDSLTIELGGIDARLLHMGPAHTRGDLAVHLPDAGVLAVGDLLEWSVPWLEGACVSGWADALRRIEHLAPESIVMSHGAVVEHGFLALYADLLEALAAGDDIGPFRHGLASAGVDVAGFDRFARDASSTTVAAEMEGACRLQ